jgi:nucleoside-diphosphate-sugar epimerase
MIDNRDDAVLVTGGAGFVGAHVARDLLVRGERVVIYDAAPNGNALDGVLAAAALDGRDERLVVVRGAITDAWRLLRLCEEQAVGRIVHLASPLTQDVTADPPSGMRDICQGTAGVFEAARACGIRRVVWASSVAVFGSRERHPDAPIPNAAPHAPDSLYGSCKSLCEQLGATYRERFGLDSIGLRLTVVYGPGRLRGYMSFPSEMIRRAAEGRPIEVPVADLAINWQYVEDVAALMVQALDAPPLTGDAFNTSGDVRTFRAAAEVLAGLAPAAQITFHDEPRDIGETTLLGAPAAFDDRELREQLGWAPAYSLEDGVARSFALFSDALARATP